MPCRVAALAQLVVRVAVCGEDAHLLSPERALEGSLKASALAGVVLDDDHRLSLGRLGTCCEQRFARRAHLAKMGLHLRGTVGAAEAKEEGCGGTLRVLGA